MDPLRAMVPTFLGLGTAKAGTTWLHALLDSHPRVWMPKGRKELNFFDDHYDRGRGWYERFFPENDAAYDAVGEITPGYLDGPDCPERIAAMPSVRKLVVALRDPVDRLYSAYGHHVRNYNYEGTFEDFVDDFPQEVERGKYARHLQRYFRHFGREQFLVLRFERLFGDVEATKRRLAGFLEIDAAAFPDEAGYATVNKTYVPRFQAIFALAQRGLRWLRRRAWGAGVLRFIQRSGLGEIVKRLLGRRDEGLPPMAPAMRRRLAAYYAADVAALETLLDDDFSAWTPGSSTESSER